MEKKRTNNKNIPDKRKRCLLQTWVKTIGGLFNFV